MVRAAWVLPLLTPVSVTFEVLAPSVGATDVWSGNPWLGAVTGSQPGGGSYYLYLQPHCLGSVVKLRKRGQLRNPGQSHIGVGVGTLLHASGRFC